VPPSIGADAPVGDNPPNGRVAPSVLRLDVAQQASYVVWDQSTDRAAGIDRGEDGAIGFQHEPGRLQIFRLGIGVATDRSADRGGVGVMPDGKSQLVLVDGVGRGGLVVDGERHHLGVEFGQFGLRPAERRELGIAVRALRPSVDQHDTVRTGQILRDGQRPAGHAGDLQLRKLVTVL